MYDIIAAVGFFFLNLWSIVLWLIFFWQIQHSYVDFKISKWDTCTLNLAFPSVHCYPISNWGTTYKRHIKLVKVKEHLIRLQIDYYCLIEIDDTDLKKIWKRLNWKRAFADCELHVVDKNRLILRGMEACSRSYLRTVVCSKHVFLRL